MNCALRLFMTLSSVSFFVIVFFVQNKKIPFGMERSDYVWVIYVAYLAIPFFLTYISLQLCKKLAKRTIKKVTSLETANNDFLANYLTFFFVALSIEKNDMVTFWVVFGMTILFTFVSRVSYFNPIFLVFGYNFYYVRTGEDVKIMLISREKLKIPEDFEPVRVSCINDYTFIKIQEL